MTTPWKKYLESLLQLDRGVEHGEAWMTERLQQRWPGPYRVVKVANWGWNSFDYQIVFDSPEDETMFTLRYL